MANLKSARSELKDYLVDFIKYTDDSTLLNIAKVILGENDDLVAQFEFQKHESENNDD